MLIVTLVGVSLTATLGITVIAQSGDTHVGDLFGDLVHIKRHPITGQPILQKREVLLPQDVPGLAVLPDSGGRERV